MRTVYKSCIVWWWAFTIIIILVKYYFPDVRFPREYNFGETYTTQSDRLFPLLFVFFLGIFFIGAFCKTVIETDEGFEVHYMYGFQKKWFGKDFLVFNYNEQYLPNPGHGGILNNTYIKLWDGGKVTYIYPTATRHFDKLNKRLNELAREYYLKKHNELNPELESENILKPNIKIVEDFAPQSFRLFHTLKDSVEWDERMKVRKTASFGVSYDYSGITYPQTEMCEELVPLCEKIEKEFGFSPNNCLINYYPDGNSSLGFHSDSSEELKKGTGVAIVSLGAERAIHYKNIENKSLIIPYNLKSGALLYMGKDVQEEWLHAIPKDEKSGARISLSFREIIK